MKNQNTGLGNRRERDLKYWDVDDAYLDHEGDQSICNLWLSIEDPFCLVWSSSLQPLSHGFSLGQ